MLYFEKISSKKSGKRVYILNCWGDHHQILGDINWTYSECTVQISCKSLHMGPRYSPLKILSFFWEASFGLKGKYLCDQSTHLFPTLRPFSGALGLSMCQSWSRLAKYFARYGSTKLHTKLKRAILCHLTHIFQTKQIFFVPFLGVAPKIEWLSSPYLK